MYPGPVTILLIIGTFKSIPGSNGETARRRTEPWNGIRANQSTLEGLRKYPLSSVKSQNPVYINRRTNPALIENIQTNPLVKTYPVRSEIHKPARKTFPNISKSSNVKNVSRIPNSKPGEPQPGFPFGKESFLAPTNADRKPKNPAGENQEYSPKIVVSQEGLDSDLFWSYYTSGSVNKASTGQGSYDRISPEFWIGSSIYPESQKNILILGEFQKISHGPRKRRNTENSDKSFQTFQRNGDDLDAPMYFDPNKQEYSTQNRPYFVKTGLVWPLKYSKAHIEMLDSRPVPETQPRDLPQQTQSWKPTPVCRHYCDTKQGDIPCCSDIFPARFGAIGPMIQPTLIENWVTGLFEFGAKNPYLYTLFKTILVFGVFSVVLYLWAIIGEKMGLAEIPRARLIPSVLEEDQRIILEIVDGNWLDELENHLVSGDYPESANRFLCCLYTNKHTGHKNNKINIFNVNQIKDTNKEELYKNREGHDKNKEDFNVNKKQEDTDKSKTKENEVTDSKSKDEPPLKTREEEELDGDEETQDGFETDSGGKNKTEMLECVRILSRRVQPDLECESNHIYDISLNLKGLRGKENKKENEKF